MSSFSTVLAAMTAAAEEQADIDISCARSLNRLSGGKLSWRVSPWAAELGGTAVCTFGLVTCVYS